jgi:uncharacterized protein DUF4440
MPLQPNKKPWTVGMRTSLSCGLRGRAQFESERSDGRRLEMRRCKIIVLAAVVFLVGYAPRIRAQDDLQELIKIKRQQSEAEVKRDIAYLDRLFADDFEMINSRGMHSNKEQTLQHIKDPNFKFTELHSDNIHVRFYGDVAVMTDQTTGRGVDKGQPFNRESRFVRIFVKDHGRWTAVLAQATPLQPDSTADGK